MTTRLTAPTAFVTHHDCSRHDTGWRHPEHQGRLPAVARAVYRDMLTLHDHLLEVEGRPAALTELERAHDAAYLARVRAGVAAAEARGEPVPFEGDTMLSTASWDALTAAAGCAITAVETVLAGEARNAFCSVRPPGSGAGRASAGNQGIVNHVAVAALHLAERHGLERVLVLEWGAEFGAGTAEIVAGTPARYLSLYGAGRGPAPSGAAAARGVALAAESDGAALQHALHTSLTELLDGWRPDFVLLSLGLDVLESDPAGSLAVRPEELYPLTRAVVEAAGRACGGRLVSVLEGGYDPPAMGRAVVHHLHALAGLPG
jgi:acetoin utilization deacetylase AcuC-like enzyme